MQCAEISDAGCPLTLVTKDFPRVPDRGFLLKTLYAGICHSDIHINDDEFDMGSGKVYRLREDIGIDNFRSIVLGHEIVGVVEELGAHVPADCPLKPGDVVAVYPWRGCRNCELCLGGLSNMCENNRGGLTEVGQSLATPGGYSTHVPIPNWELGVLMPSSIPYKFACMLPCSALTSFSTLLRTKPHLERSSKVRGIANLLIIGAGGLGQWAAILAVQTSLFQDIHINVTVADVNETKLKVAKKSIGVHHVLLWDAEADVDSTVALTTKDNKFDAVVDFVGTSLTQNVALRILHKGGAMASVGLFGGEIQFPPALLTLGCLTMYGQRTGSINEFQQLLDLTQTLDWTKLQEPEVVTLAEINAAFDKLKKGLVKWRAVIVF